MEKLKRENDKNLLKDIKWDLNMHKDIFKKWKNISFGAQWIPM